MESVKILRKEPGKAPEYLEIPNTLKAFQSMVCGYIETVTLFEDLVLVCSEEGLLRDMPYNMHLYGPDFYGPIVICGTKGPDFSDVPYEFCLRFMPQLWLNGVEPQRPEDLWST